MVKQKFEQICPRCGLDRVSALGDSARGYSSLMLLMGGCLNCAEVLRAWEELQKQKEKQ